MKLEEFVSNNGNYSRVLSASIVAGLLGVGVSSLTLAKLPHGAVVLPWNFPLPAILLVVLSGIFLGYFVFLKPQTYWPVLIISNLVTAGVYVLRFPIYDEYLTACVIFGVALAILRGRVPVRPREDIPKGWFLLFALLLCHMALMSIFGAVVIGNPKAWRFVLIYLEILVAVVLLVGYNFRLLAPREFSRLVLMAGCCYYVACLLHGFGANLMGTPQAIMEGIGFGGTAYQAVPAIVIVPVALIALKRSDWHLRMLAVISMLLGLVVAILADSRAGMLPLVFFAIAAPIVLGFGRAMKMAGISAVAVVLISWMIVGHSKWVLDMADAIGRTFTVGGSMTYQYYGRTVTASKGDTGRFLYAEAGAEALLDNPEILLSGAGSYSYFPVAGPYYERSVTQVGSNANVVNYGSSVGGISEPPRPPALGAVIIEFGMIGVMLYLALFAINLITAIFRVRRPQGGVLISRMGVAVGLPTILIPLWWLFGEVQDVVLLYLVLAPFGITYALSRPAKADGGGLKSEH